MNIWLLFCWGSLNDRSVDIEKTLSPKPFSPLHLHIHDVALLSYHIKLKNFVSTNHQNMSSEMSGRHLQEVTDVVRDSIEQRIKQCDESLYNRRQPKHKKMLAPASALFVKGNHSVTCYIVN